MDNISNSNESDVKSHGLSPIDFDNFLPWACRQMHVEAYACINRIEQVSDNYSQSGTTSGRRKSRKLIKPKEEIITADSTVKESPLSQVFGIKPGGNVINIDTIYDQNEKLTELRFQRNKYIPRGLLQIIALIVEFYPRLTSIKINRGLKQDGLYEVSKILSLSKVTEIILDDTDIPEANYYILLDKNNSLKYLSLARCKLNDAAVELIAAKLLTSSLSILNLTSNSISDAGAMYIGETLRFNRKLTYLNLADNLITDAGASGILNSLMPFALNSDEVKGMKVRHIAYLKQKNELIQKIYNDLFASGVRMLGSEKKSAKKKLVKSAPYSAKKLKSQDKDLCSLKNLEALSTPNIIFDPTLLAKAEETAKSSLGSFKDPFQADNTFTDDGVVYCCGNNALCYLNLAYNNLSYFTVKKLYEVLSAQENARRLPRGLVNVCIEGNNMPEACPELNEIDYILHSGLVTTQKVSTMIRRRPGKSNKK